jgi:hypothetical protein
MNKNSNISNVQQQEEQLLAYVNNTMSQEERYAFEKTMNDNEFLSDATEGLSNLNSPKSLDEYVTKLNNQLHTLTQSSKKKREKRKLQVQDWIILAVVLIIALCTLAYYILNKKGIY